MSESSHMRRGRRFRFFFASCAMVAFSALLGWGLAELTDDPVVSFISSSLAAVAGVGAMWARFLHEWTPQTARDFRHRLVRLYLRFVAIIGVATAAFILYLMAVNNSQSGGP